ncbi:MAG: bifunctional hydroxymethylpyrimidine kinase/phosphomethylpyrimidine kinase [Cyanobacteria bacterium HKST-UBA06]|nr:bifunctional hydroxymethylpyrimidine kinase/phosphomethylpyrimidine kinase [Cyanobacteria bacterium HKST-UBA04]MCA9808172.1 bifunctional hydroxymethylpyrimidine kinase/phosphomethylpyrimidine kinase [Cyanobacteria bacterium HKST-UBA06]MCA9842250.1 bifunctional hydroxymethylpyrimidine kinase/phosphomethylpyrimidine kinase [Cyanobacteria bacterium HKST-UBA03]
MKKTDLQTIIANLPKGRVMVVGDIAIDEMTYGQTSRLSREAPVIILQHERSDILLGGGGNAAHNVAALGGHVTMVGVCGKDYYSTLLVEAMERDGVSPEGLVHDASRPTTTKTRIIGNARQSVRQQIVRIDREDKTPVSGPIEKKLISHIEALAPKHHALILSDYDIGAITPAVIETCKAVCRKHNLIFAVDSHRKLAMFEGATVATPNQPEAEFNLGQALRSVDDVHAHGHSLRQSAGLQHLLITQGKDGMTLFDADGHLSHIEAFNVSDVFDVTGAGDTVIAALTLAMASGATPLEGAVLGNLAASLVVRRFGTATATPPELLEALDKLNPGKLAIQSRVPTK